MSPSLDSLIEREQRPAAASGRLVYLALPSLVGRRLEQTLKLFTALGANLNEGQRRHLELSLRHQTEEGFTRYAAARLIVEYQINESGVVHYTVKCERLTLADRYAEWVERGEILFGSHADAMVLACAAELGSEPLRVLDVGAGNGRNTLELARAGHRVDALEGTREFAEQIEYWASRQQLPVRVLHTDFLEDELRAPEPQYDLIVAAQVTSHFRDSDDLSLLFRRGADLLSENGRLAASIFIADDAVATSELARECGQARWSTFFTREECEQAAAVHGLRCVTDVGVVAYEKANLPREAWPPTSWFKKWAEGGDVFLGQPSPLELRWHVYTRA